MGKKITDLPSATTPLTGAELFETVQGGVSKKVAASDIGGGTSYLVKTYAELVALINSSGLVAGTLYKISDRGDRGLFFTAISTTELAKDGTRLMLCPTFYGVGGDGVGTITYNNLSGGVFSVGNLLLADNDAMATVLAVGVSELTVTWIIGNWSSATNFYEFFIGDVAADIVSYSYAPKNNWIGVWNSTKNPATDDLAIWGGRVWRSLTGNIGTAIDDAALDSTNWVVVPKNSFSNDEYVEKKFGCTYDVTNDWIERQWDGAGNILGIDYYTEITDEQLGFNLCDVSDWNFANAGNAREFYDNRCIGIWNNSNDGYGIFENNNYDGISNNSNGGEINVNNNLGSIRNNSNTSSISYNTNAGAILNNSNNGSINYNTNAGAIQNNSGGLNNGMSILGNTNGGTIESNSNDGNIRYNNIGGYIAANSNGTFIEYNNNAANINDNTNTGSITKNTNQGSIIFNDNAGNINNNNNGGDIRSNTDSVTNIQFNSNNGQINGNSNIGTIEYNSNGGEIISCTSGTDPCNIFSNINNGYISGTFAADVNDTIVNKS